ncbi:MAG: hypothetical protein LBP64_05720 [Tannerella sp.]|jgi:hypothetical protein|nr:hypothetical protein [Tannerella sp.]
MGVNIRNREVNISAKEAGCRNIGKLFFCPDSINAIKLQGITENIRLFVLFVSKYPYICVEINKQYEYKHVGYEKKKCIAAFAPVADLRLLLQGRQRAGIAV